MDEAESRPFILRALELGINFFDNADMYSQGVSEEVVGRALHDFGASIIHHLEEAVAALEVQLSPEERAYLEEPYQPHPVQGHS